ncbi:acyl-CoA transferase [Candidatus Pantoea deserta]|uniref:Acyl-CoA transferase n=1 Tax=Candidatus Pantoea deserta TaxID=1869313 RepID=A0A3N4NP00_9GAMM|nr:CoA transferase [Pantoea deserta]RPD98024.1 acyl-CoA transferase [Pantoea deserta]
MDYQRAASLWQQLWQGLRGPGDATAPPTFLDRAAFVSAFAVSELAAASTALATRAAADFIGSDQPVSVNVRLASRWFQSSFMPHNRPAPALWDAFAGDYRSADGWIRLHTNAPHHRAAMTRVLGQPRDRDALAQQVARWQAEALEQAVIDAGGCAARMRSESEWRAHPQGQAVSNEPLISWQPTLNGDTVSWPVPTARPLLGVRVLDLTRVIAGPVATRFLASLGAQVLRIDPPDWDEPSLNEEMNCGKRRAVVDVKTAAGRDRLRQLLQQADVLVHGYRADALERLGFDAESRARLSPGLVDIGLNAWGWQGPWRNRRGFDSLVQMACGIAHSGMTWSGRDTPTPLPVQALDHATGYLMAAAALEGLRQRRATGYGVQARLSLARTALLLQQHPVSDAPLSAGISAHRQDTLSTTELTPWGIGERLRAAARLPGTPQLCATPGCQPGTHPARW